MTHLNESCIDALGTQSCNRNPLVVTKEVNKFNMNVLSSCTFESVLSVKPDYLHTSLKSVTVSIGNSIFFAMSVSSSSTFFLSY